MSEVRKENFDIMVDTFMSMLLQYKLGSLSKDRCVALSVMMSKQLDEYNKEVKCE